MFLFDDCTTKRALLDINEVESVDVAKRAWDALTPRDQSLRDAYFVTDSEDLDSANVLWQAK